MKLLLSFLFLSLLAGCAALRPLEIKDLVISDAQVWQGVVSIAGVVRVTRTGSLTLLPGTKLVFTRIDQDDDGIGDAELVVEGSFEARGTVDQPILLTSGAPDPRPGDWKFLYFDYARHVEIAHLISEYAYSGVQIHFCRAQIIASEFRNNIDGVRFSTANVTLRQSFLHHNRHGIRYEERGGHGLVQHNRISNNQIGIFAVTRGTGQTLFEQNDIVENRPYQIKMGQEQTHALDFPRNWWGDVSGLTVETVFDQRNDHALGRVSATEPLVQSVTGF